MTTPGLRRRPPSALAPPRLDAAQRAVVRHEGGPLLVLAGPGTGKTTTLVETVVHRVQQRGLAPEQVLVLTFSRKAAQELRERITGRLGVTTRGPVAMTFHSYAFALLRRELAVPGGRGVRLLSGPEQDLEVARLLQGELADGAVRWPAELRDALPLRGFRQELRDLLLRAQERGLDGPSLALTGRQHGRPAWVAAGGFLAAYDARFDLDPSAEVLDYAGLVRAAAGLLETDPELRAREREARAVVLVDELQDTDPAQLRLLQALADGGRDLVAVGDPDQSIYAFRGADVRGILSFRDTFRTVLGAPAPLVVLQTCRRSGQVLLDASRALARGLPAGALGPGRWELTADPPAGTGPGRVEVRLAASPTQEAALVADVLRRAHLHEGVAWSEMAVLLRSTPRSLAVLRRGLLAAGVPVGVPSDEVPLVEEPLVRALLDLMSAALRPAAVEVDAALGLLLGPLGRADGLAVRRLRRGLRELDLTAGLRSPADELLVTAVLEPAEVLELSARVRAPLDRVHRLLAAARLEDGSAEDALWAVWAASGLAGRLEADSLAGGTRGAMADRSLDAVIALFDAAARYVDRLPGQDALGFLDDVAAQEVPGDTLSARTPVGDAVRLLTAHASKGLEWRLVVVAGVQEGGWPDLRLRGSLLGVDELSAAAQHRTPAAPGPDRRAELLAEERRLFYVAVTRARERLVITAVAGAEGDDRPSRFLGELGVEVPERPQPVGRPLTPSGLVAELRQVAADPGAGAALREAACRRLARLASPDGGAPRLAAAAHPDRWWGMAALSDDGPLVQGQETVRVSPSRVESYDTCALRWLLEGAVGVAGTTGPAQVLGTLVHALAELGSGPDALPESALVERLDEVLPELDLGAPWALVRRRAEAVEQLGKFVRWAAAQTRELLGTELTLEVPFGDRAVLAGRVDRLERDDAGRGVVVDLKTGSSKPAKDELGRHPQLGVYQLAVALGAFAEQHAVTIPGGAALLQLKGTKQAAEQRQPPLGEDAEPNWAYALVTRVVEGMSGRAFPATVNDGCRSCKVRTSCPAQPDGQGVLR